MNNIKIIDSIMGSGKTTWAIDYMNTNPNKRFIYVTPFLDEIKRIKESVNREMWEPKSNNKDGSKLTSLKNILQTNHDICTTHALFQNVDAECIELIKKENIVLILDEALEAIAELPYTEKDIRLLESAEFISAENNGLVKWLDNDSTLFYSKAMQELERMTKLGQVIKINESKLMWQFVPEIFHAFTDVYVLTYNFDVSTLRHYFDANNILYKKKSIQNGKLIEYKPEDLSKYKSLINIYSGALNTNIPNVDVYSFSKTYYEKNAELTPKIKNNIYNYFYNIMKSPSSENMWTTFKPWQSALSGKGYTKGFVPCTARATNKYKDKSTLVFPINIYMRPLLVQYFKNLGCEVDQDGYALNILIQWIWRSRIRENKPISIYLPSARMRYLLYRWLGYTNEEIQVLETNS